MNNSKVEPFELKVQPYHPVVQDQPQGFGPNPQIPPGIYGQPTSMFQNYNPPLIAPQTVIIVQQPQASSKGARFTAMESLEGLGSVSISLDNSLCHGGYFRIIDMNDNVLFRTDPPYSCLGCMRNLLCFCCDLVGCCKSVSSCCCFDILCCRTERHFPFTFMTEDGNDTFILDYIIPVGCNCYGDTRVEMTSLDPSLGSGNSMIAQAILPYKICCKGPIQGKDGLGKNNIYTSLRQDCCCVAGIKRFKYFSNSTNDRLGFVTPFSQVGCRDANKRIDFRPTMDIHSKATLIASAFLIWMAGL